MTATVRIMECHVEKERPFLFRLTPLLFLALEELPDKELDLGDISTHLKNGIGLFCVGEIKRVDRAWTNMFFPDDTFPKKSNHELCKTPKFSKIHSCFECLVTKNKLGFSQYWVSASIKHKKRVPKGVKN